jgi:hypothetical protein
MTGCRCLDGVCFCRPDLPELESAPAPEDPELIADEDLYHARWS